MPGIISVGIGRPEGYYSQRRVFEALGHREIWWPISQAAGIEGRPLFTTPERMVSRTTQEQQDDYAKAVLSLSRQAIIEALEAADTGFQEIGCFVFTSCTGVPLCPSFPSLIGGELGFSPNCLFLPLHGIGCQGSGPALRVAWDWLRANPGQKALICSAEISNASYHHRTMDGTKINKGVYIGNSIFGDGAGAVVMGTDKRSLRILSFYHHTQFEHKGKIGMEWLEDRYRLVLASDVPRLASPLAVDVGRMLLKQSAWEKEEVRYFLIHSGGSSIIKQFQGEMGISDSQIRFSWETWREVGNLSSATIIFALHKLFASGELRKGDKLILITLGAGIECDGATAIWEG